MDHTRAIPHCPREQMGPKGMAVVAGKPIPAGDRELVPLVGVASFLCRRAFVGTGRERACARGAVRLRPIGVVERRGGCERAIPIRDMTSGILALLAIAGLLVPTALALAAALTHLRRGRPAAARHSGLREAL